MSLSRLNPQDSTSNHTHFGDTNKKPFILTISDHWPRMLVYATALWNKRRQLSPHFLWRFSGMFHPFCVVLLCGGTLSASESVQVCLCPTWCGFRSVGLAVMSVSPFGFWLLSQPAFISWAVLVCVLNRTLCLFHLPVSKSVAGLGKPRLFVMVHKKKK